MRWKTDLSEKKVSRHLQGRTPKDGLKKRKPRKRGWGQREGGGGTKSKPREQIVTKKGKREVRASKSPVGEGRGPLATQGGKDVRGKKRFGE